jgi:hypothetical protein
MFLTPDRFDRRRDPQPDEDEQHREHRIVAGVDEVSDVEDPADGDRRAARQAVIQLVS